MTRVKTKTEVSAGGVAFRQRDGLTEVALISVGEKGRWQLPKGLVDENETTELTAMREVREETGIEAEMIGPIDKVEYWYYSTEDGLRVRVHKFVYFFLLRYMRGDVRDHDYEVNEARWIEIQKAQEMLAFKSEKEIVARARELLNRED